MAVCQLVYDDLVNCRGVGPDATLLKKSLDAVFFDFCQSESLGSTRRQMLKAIDETFRECSVQNWDCYGAEPVKLGALREARRLARALAPDLPPPNVGADPDGEISFEWDFAPRRVFSVSVSEEGTLSYAGLFDGGKVCGTEDFKATVPPFVLMSIRRLLRTAH